METYDHLSIRLDEVVFLIRPVCFEFILESAKYLKEN
jgi:hypothetical protein